MSCAVCQRECIGGWLRGDDGLVCLSCITDALGAADQYDLSALAWDDQAGVWREGAPA